MPYEKVGKNEPVCIADEVPFEIPESWEWARLKDLTIKEIKRGKSPKYADDGSVYVFAQKCNVKLGGIDVSLAKFLDMRIFDKYPVEEYMADGDIIINSTGNGTLGRIGIFRDSDRINDFVIVPDSHVTIIRIGNQMIKDYLFFALKYHQPYLEKLGEGSTNQTELRPSTVTELFIPVPPIGEQKRIVAKLLEVLPMADVYGIKEKSLQDYNKDFPVQLKKSILQEAVQGKLVPQDPADEPASILLERIRAEKQKLIAEGKIKKDKHESVIFRRDNSHYEKRGSKEVCIDDDIPFEVPDSWELIRLNDIGDYRKGPFGSSLTKSMFVPQGIDTVKVYEQKNAIQKDHTLGSYYIKRDYYESKMSSFTVLPGDIIVSCAGTIGETYVMPSDIELGIINQALMRMRIYAPINIDYFLLYFDYVIKKEAKENSKGSAIKNIPPFEIFKKIIFPLPPLEEQKRIVEQVQRMLQWCDKLSSAPIILIMRSWAESSDVLTMRHRLRSQQIGNGQGLEVLPLFSQVNEFLRRIMLIRVFLSFDLRKLVTYIEGKKFIRNFL